MDLGLMQMEKFINSSSVLMEKVYFILFVAFSFSQIRFLHSKVDIQIVSINLAHSVLVNFIACFNFVVWFLMLIVEVLY